MIPVPSHVKFVSQSGELAAMVYTQEKSAVREAVGNFDGPDTLQEAIDELLTSGFDRAELSLLARETAVQEKLGHKYRKVSELEDEADVPWSAHVSTEAVGDAEGAVIGGLMYIGAGVLMGPAAFAGGTLASIAGAAAIGGGIGGGHWINFCPLDRRTARKSYRGAARPRWLTPLGPSVGCGAREKSR